MVGLAGDHHGRVPRSFFALWVMLLGPALLTLLNPRQS
jgi:hypothetical protein